MMASSPAAPLFRAGVNIKVTQGLFYSRPLNFPLQYWKEQNNRDFSPYLPPQQLVQL